MSHAGNVPVAHNAFRLLWAGFAAILAAGVGFAIRGGILDNWGREFSFTNADLGVIGGAGLTGFCFGIFIGGIIVDRIGYGKLVVAAFLFHVVSALITFAADPDRLTQQANYNILFWATFIFAVANGTLEAVANPLIATLFPNNRTHYLNILHASWPAGLVLGGAAGWVLDDHFQIGWKIQLALFLLPTVAYGVMFLGQTFPKSEASSKGLSLGEMLKDVGMLGGIVACFMLSLFFASILQPVTQNYGGYTHYIIGFGIGAALLIAMGAITNFSTGSWLLFVLFITHAMVGAVELGTDGWIQNITGNILSSSEGKILFVCTSLVMFALRFCADFIEKKMGLSPIGILFVCAMLACLGLNLTSTVNSFGMALLALIVYGFGKTFFWPTMLAVTSDRFPRTGAIAISIMGGIGMMSAGLLGGPGLGYFKDRYAGEALAQVDPQLFEANKAEKDSHFLMFKPVRGIDPSKQGALVAKLSKLRETNPNATATDLGGDDATVLNASIQGDRKLLITDSLIPATMAVIYLLLALYFRAIGGYRQLTIADVERQSATAA